MEALAGAIVGGFFALAGGILAHWYEERRKRISLRAAFRAEIQNILRIVTIRDYKGLFQRAIREWEADRECKPIIIGGDVSREEPVFSENIDKIGLLGRDAASGIVEFYGVVEGIKTDIRGLCLGQLDSWTNADKARLFKEDLNLWENAKKTGGGLVATLERPGLVSHAWANFRARLRRPTARPNHP